MQHMTNWRSFHHPLLLTSALQKQGSSVSFLMGWKGITRYTGNVKEDPQNAALGQMMTWHLGPKTESCVFLRARLAFTNVRPAIGLSFHASNLGWLTMGFYWAAFKVVISILATWKDAQHSMQVWKTGKNARNFASWLIPAISSTTEDTTLQKDISVTSNMGLEGKLVYLIDESLVASIAKVGTSPFIMYFSTCANFCFSWLQDGNELKPLQSVLWVNQWNKRGVLEDCSWGHVWRKAVWQRRENVWVLHDRQNAHMHRWEALELW